MTLAEFALNAFAAPRAYPEQSERAQHEMFKKFFSNLLILLT